MKSVWRGNSCLAGWAEASKYPKWLQKNEAWFSSYILYIYTIYILYIYYLMTIYHEIVCSDIHPQVWDCRCKLGTQLAASSTRRSTSATTCLRHSEPQRQLTPFSWKDVHAQDSIKQKHTKTIIIINHTKSDNDDKINTHTHKNQKFIYMIYRERERSW